MKRPIDVAVHTSGECWVAAAEMEIDAESVVRPALDELRIEFGGGTSLGRTVELELGAFQRRSDVSRLPLRWGAREHGSLFPTMEAELQLSDAGPAETEVRLVGEYEPPLGALGAMADRMAGHRIAERSVRDFLEGVAGRLRERLTVHSESVFWRTRPILDERSADPGRA
jgi:hypothetical protein